ncbi:MAG: fructose-bisphosphate aldolase [Desulfobacterales bacterium]|nr:fructose-bisphosphate aldolase [Desulfobacterales bacterium]
MIEIDERDVHVGVRHPRQRPRAGALRRTLPGDRPGADRSEPEVLMDGAHGIERCEAVTARVLEEVFTEARCPRRAVRGHAAEAEHGDPRHEMLSPGSPVVRVAEADPLPAALCAGGGAGYRVSVRRPERGRRRRPSECHERDGPAAVAGELFLRPCRAGSGTGSLEGTGGRCRGRAEGTAQAQPAERPGARQQYARAMEQAA